MSAPEKIGKYEIKRQIGRGAMGAVFEAYDSVIERRVALKLLRVELFEGNQMADVRARFKREAHSAGRLSHPHIVTIFDYGEHEGTPYIVMDFMSGKELSRHLEGGKRMPLGEVVRVMGQLLGALAYAHDSGVVHRDIKPANIFVLHDGSVKVVDFGVARIEASQLTDTGAMIGTPAYMSPEQFLGLPVDARSDIFSCGVILYQLLTGDAPFTGSVTTIMQKVLRQDPVEPSALNPTLSHAWDSVVERALAKKPEARYLSARQFAEAIKAAHEARAEPSSEPTLMNVKVDVTLPQTQPPVQERTYEKTVPLDRSAPAAKEKKAFPHLAVALSGLAVVVVAAGGWFFLKSKPVEPVVAQAPVAPVVDEAAQRAKAEAEMRARVETEVRSKMAAETQAKAEAGARAKAEAEAQAKAEAARAKAEQAARAKAAAEARAKSVAEARAKAEAEAQAKAEAEARAKAEAQARAKTETRASREAARKAAETEARAKREAKAAEARAARAQATTTQAASAQAATARAATAPPAASSPYRGKVVSLERDWGFVVVESQAMGGVRLGDRLAASLSDGRRVELTVRRISGNLVSATPEGKLLDELLGAAVGPK